MFVFYYKFKILGDLEQVITRFLLSIKNNKVFLNKDEEKTMYRCIENKINIKNVTALYNFFELFNSLNASKLPLQFIERSFPMFAESTSFLELDFKRF